MTSRIKHTFDRLATSGDSAFVSYIMSFDPDYKTSLELMKSLPQSGVDIIELGMAFSDPMADGSTIEKAANRALKAGATVKNTLKMVAEFRESDNETPVILMGYFNPILHYGVKSFVKDAVDTGVDGVIIVDLTPEEEGEFIIHSDPAGLAHIKLTAPTTTKERAKVVLKNASGFVYYISVAGITGGKSADVSDIDKKLKELREVCDLPIVVGFGIKTPAQARDIANIADGVVVGSAFVNHIADNQDSPEKLIAAVSGLASDISNAMKNSA